MMTEISSREVDASCSNYVAKPASLNLPPDALVDLVYGYNFSMIDHLSWTGKLMAYASLGVPSPDIEALMSKYLRNHAQGGELMPVGLVRACCESLNGQRAVAAAAQAQFETYMLELVKDLLKELSGCALNVLANQVIYDTLSENAKDPIGIYVPAAPNDSGLSVGGAWSLVQPAEKQQLQYAGFRLWDDSILEKMAVAWGARRLSEMGGVNFLAELLSTGPPGEKPIVAVVRGRQEFGPRALGHRSLLAVPDSALMRDRMNRLKGRQWFRPVAPMIADEALRQVFGREVKSPYMSMAPRVLEEVLKEFPALAHLDGTARHQSVGAKDEPWVHALLLAVGKHTGLAALINTSFNSKGRPIANTVKESLDMLRELSDLDYVLIEDWLFKAPGRQ
ncbi:3'-hydroxymethylcephem-O-carbamoyltransferase (3'-hydroxymethylcephem-O-CASE) (CCT) [Durusdinium trenchii]